MKFTKKPSANPHSRKCTLKKGVFALSLLIGALFVLPTIFFMMKSQERDKDNKRVPVTEYALEILRNESDFTGCGQKGRGEIKELPSDVDMLPVNSHWWAGLSALPVSQSSVIIIGEITDAQARLSNDKTSVYTDFTIKVEETLKHDRKKFEAGDVVTIVRCGGGVRFSSGKTQYYQTAHQGFPGVGGRYVLFLSNNEDKLSILTGYEIDNNRIVPLDGIGSNESKAQLPFSAYYDVSSTIFLNDLRKSVASRKKIDNEGSK